MQIFNLYTVQPSGADDTTLETVDLNRIDSGQLDSRPQPQRRSQSVGKGRVCVVSRRPGPARPGCRRPARASIPDAVRSPDGRKIIRDKLLRLDWTLKTDASDRFILGDTGVLYNQGDMQSLSVPLSRGAALYLTPSDRPQPAIFISRAPPARVVGSSASVRSWDASGHRSGAACCRIPVKPERPPSAPCNGNVPKLPLDCPQALSSSLFNVRSTACPLT